MSDLSQAAFVRCLLRANNREPITGLTRFQKLAFLCEHGGLDRDPVEPIGHDTVFSYHQFKNGPFSYELRDTIEQLRDDRDIETTSEHMNQTEQVTVYRLTDAGAPRLRHRQQWPQVADKRELPHTQKVIECVKNCTTTIRYSHLSIRSAEHTTTIKWVAALHRCMSDRVRFSKHVLGALVSYSVVASIVIAVTGGSVPAPLLGLVCLCMMLMQPVMVETYMTVVHSERAQSEIVFPNREWP